MYLMITCPYCGLPNWEKTGQVLNDTRRFLIVNMCKCKNDNCGKMFYLVRTRMGTFTVKLDDVDPQELAQYAPRQVSQPRHSHGKKRKSRASSGRDNYREKHDSLRREEEKKS
ncbi:MAG: hypothetical protein GXO23_02920 [Crenarchaeota archaeon]|nr:hypothetical protein [Thermoproteota archaeon]